MAPSEQWRRRALLLCLLAGCVLSAQAGRRGLTQVRRRCCPHSCCFGGSAARLVVHKHAVSLCSNVRHRVPDNHNKAVTPPVSATPAHPSCCGQGTLWAPTLAWLCCKATPWRFDLQTSDGIYDAGEVECKAAEELCNKISCSGEPGGLA